MLYIIFEFIFAIHMITGFFYEMHMPGTVIPIRNLRTIANHYILGEFKYNIIPLVPLTEIL